MDVCVRLFCAQVATLLRADPPSMESYRLYMGFVTASLSLTRTL
jgi:hypothetical protein